MQRNSCFSFSTFYNLECASQPYFSFWNKSLIFCVLLWWFEPCTCFCIHWHSLSYLASFMVWVWFFFFSVYKIQFTYILTLKVMQTKGNIVSEENKIPWKGSWIRVKKSRLDLPSSIDCTAALREPLYLFVLVSYSTLKRSWVTVAMSFIFSMLLSLWDPKSCLWLCNAS